MTFSTRPLLAAVLASVALAGCGSQSDESAPVSARLVGATATSPGQIILSQLGRERIGVQTASVRGVPAGQVVVPYASLVYDPNGKTYVFTQRDPLTFVEVPATVARIAGDSVYLKVGPRPGAKVVTVGAEELYGVQTGVLAQT